MNWKDSDLAVHVNHGSLGRYTLIFKDAHVLSVASPSLNKDSTTEDENSVIARALTGGIWYYALGETVALEAARSWVLGTDSVKLKATSVELLQSGPHAAGTCKSCGGSEFTFTVFATLKAVLTAEGEFEQVGEISLPLGSSSTRIVCAGCGTPWSGGTFNAFTLDGVVGRAC
jgi:hypothetical protein